MEDGRRRFLKGIAGASALGLAMGAHASPERARQNAPVSALAPAGDTAVKGGPSDAPHWAMVIDIRKLTLPHDVDPLIRACHRAHNVPSLNNPNHEIKWIWNETFENAFPMQRNPHLPDSVERRPFPVLCNHCDNPPCVRACPTKATFKRDDGIVAMDFHRCIGCRFCMAACPYGARSFNYVGPRPAIRENEYNSSYPTRTKGVVEKCNLCVERLAEGKMPACAEASDGAIVVGDINDPDSPVRKLLSRNFTIRRKPDLGTEPSVYYIIC